MKNRYHVIRRAIVGGRPVAMSTDSLPEMSIDPWEPKAKKVKKESKAKGKQHKEKKEKTEVVIQVTPMPRNVRTSSSSVKANAHASVNSDSNNGSSSSSSSSGNNINVNDFSKMLSTIKPSKFEKADSSAMDLLAAVTGSFEG